MKILSDRWPNCLYYKQYYYYYLYYFNENSRRNFREYKFFYKDNGAMMKIRIFILF